MIELRFHRTVYPGEMVDAAIKVYDRFAKIERAEESEHWVVRVRAKGDARERKVAGELGNYALGLTLRARRRT